MSAVNFPAADFTPQLAGYTGQGAFRFWCQKVLPLVYDDSLSYYELLAKVVHYLNNVIKDFGTMVDNLDEVIDTFNELQDYVNSYLDIQTAVDNKLDELVADGTFDRVFSDNIVSAVRQWMADNPDVTTTVQDGAISPSKLNPALYNEIYRKFWFNSMAQVGEKVVVDNVFSDRYEEGMTYNPLTGKLLLAYWKYTQPSAGIIAEIDPDTGETLQTWSYPFARFQTINYDYHTEKIICSVTGYSEQNIFYFINANDMEDYQEVEMPGTMHPANAWGFDPISNKYYKTRLDSVDGNYTWKYYVYEYDENLNYVKTYEFDLKDGVDYPPQGFCVYDRKVYQITWYSIVIMDLDSLLQYRVEYDGIMELEDCCFIDDSTLCLVGHNAAYRVRTIIYQCNKNSTPPLYKELQQKMTRTVLNTDLNLLIGDGIYTVQITDDSSSASLNYPLDETQGILISLPEYSAPKDSMTGCTQIFLSRYGSEIYRRKYTRRPGTSLVDYFSAWIDAVPRFKSFTIAAGDEGFDTRYGFIDLGISGDFVVLDVVCTNRANTTCLVSMANGSYRAIVATFYGTGSYQPYLDGSFSLRITYQKLF